MARITTTRNGRGFSYEIRDSRGGMLATGWVRGSQREAREEAKQHALELGVEAA